MKTIYMLVSVLAFAGGSLGEERDASACSGYGCDYTDPSATGCSGSAYNALYSGNIWDSDGTNLGFAVLRYSTGCATAWGKTFSNIGAIYCHASVHRTDGRWTAWQGGDYTSCYSDQLYDGAGVWAYSSGCLSRDMWDNSKCASTNWY